MTARPPLVDGTVADAMVTDVLVLDAGAQVREAAERLHGAHISGAPVVDELGRLVAVVTMRDLLLYARAEVLEVHAPISYYDRSLSWLPGRVAEAGTADPVVAAPHWPLERAAETMRSRGLRRLPVVDDHRQVVGVLSIEVIEGIIRFVSRRDGGARAAAAGPGESARDQHRALGQVQDLVGDAADQ
jgi:CBS domain-containing protein